MAETPPSKRDVLTAILARGDAYLHLDARHAEVAVPAWLKQDPNLCLQIGYDLPVPIPDLTIDDRGVRATLSFRREPFQCFVPWPAVYLIVDAESRGMLWEEDVPPQTRVPSPRPGQAPPLKAKRRLHSVPQAHDGDSAGASAQAETDAAPDAGPREPPPEPPRPSRPQLKLVK